MHPNEHNYVNQKFREDQKKKQNQDYQKMNDIKDLIVLLIAKENLPIRIVESKYFSQLLQGKFIWFISFEWKFSGCLLCVKLFSPIFHSYSSFSLKSISRIQK